MYDDATFYQASYTPPPVHSQGTHKPKHRRKQSLLERPSTEVTQADERADVDALDPIEETKESGPPQATLNRRAQSYTDFHHAVTRVLKQSATKAQSPKRKARTLEDVEVHPPSSNGLQSDLDFQDLYQRDQASLLESSHDKYRDYHKQLTLWENHLDGLVVETTETLDFLDDLAKSFKAVEAQTSSFQKQCEGLIQEKQRTEKLANELEYNMKYYSILEPITKRLNAPGAGNLVRSKDFSEMLARIDECLAYMTAHPKHRESATYLSRYKQLMTRGLTLIRVNFVGGLRDIASDVSRRIADKQLNDTTMSALLYAKFRVGASELKQEAQEIRKRAVIPDGAGDGTEGEYSGLMNELYTSYAATRGKLVIPLARKKINDIAMAPSTSKDLISFARSAIGYTKGICSDEYDLWQEWFVGDDGMYELLEAVCEPLFDHLRPRIIHETELLKLCELCTLLQNRYMHEQEDDEPFETNQLDFAGLIHPALEDAQTRLVFRAQTILRDEIERYKPKKEDLDYPNRNRQVSLSGTKSSKAPLSGRKNSIHEPTTPMPKTPMIVEEGDSPTTRFNFDTEAALEGWYPTLRKAIWLLSRIYRLVNSTVFDDLAHNIVHTTTLSLLSASHSISSLPHRTPSDGRLFLIKHFLVLKSQIVAFDIEYVTPDISFDFSNFTNTFYELRDRGGLFDPRNWYRLIRESVGGGLLPKVVENMLDAKVELDGRLRSVINDFTASYANAITTPINSSAVASPRFDAMAAVGKVKEIAGKEIALLRKKLDEYLDDQRTKETLVSAVQEMVIGNYETFYDAFTMETKNGNGKEAGKKSKKGKGRDDQVWDIDMFSEWAAGAFAVRDMDGASSRGGRTRRTSYTTGSMYSR